MLNIDEINNTIETLENSSTTFDTCNKLASLYIVRDKLQTQTALNKVETELNDILPQYRLYCTVKRKYQLHELPETSIHLALQDVCTEIKEFMQTLYSSTDTPEERKLIHKLVTELKEAF